MPVPKYYISKENEFVIENYHSAPTFASFLPGIAGQFGCPMWVFYTDRCQAVTSAGVFDKNGAILEFQPANKAIRNVALQGFRTFIKIDGKFYEPFSERSPHPKSFRITPDSLKIIETNQELKLKIEVTYFTVPNESFPALARIVKLTNLTKKRRRLEVVDGLPVLIPFGFDDHMLKNISQTIQAWCSVENLDRDAPFYKLKVTPADVAETKYIEKGHFYLAFADNGKKLKMIVNPKTVFGEISSLEFPETFINSKKFKVPAKQLTEGIMPCAFAYENNHLHEVFVFSSIIGEIGNVAALNKLKGHFNRSYLEAKYRENKELIAGICERIKTGSAATNFDLYAQYTFLDNVMRGGLPVTFGDKTIYIYYRKHGDMERDYNDFKLIPTFFSQGNGNYRDINQNRRNDLFFNPDLGADNIVRFFNLIQLDGYNPLVLFGSQYYLKTEAGAKALLAKHFAAPQAAMVEELTKPFLLGFFLKAVANAGLQYKTSREKFVAELLQQAAVEETAVHSEGFWIDHGFYNTDLLESFEAIFPDRLTDLLFNKADFTFFENDHFVLERAKRYILKNGQVRQYQSVQADPGKQAKNGSYRTTLAAKLLVLIVNKAASFDAAGIGLEMEADKPDWYDALNGLPGLLGSSLSEMLELKRLCRYLAIRWPQEQAIKLPEEVKTFLAGLAALLGKELSAFDYWDESNSLKEEYRAKIRAGLSGQEKIVEAKEAANFLNKVVAKCDQAVKSCLKQYGTYVTYFINEIVEYDEEKGLGIRAKRFKQTPLPLFLEGFVHALKVEGDRSIYRRVKTSPLYDHKLKMYKVNAPLDKAPLEIGRARVFTPGWLENESIWLHMEYKYMLELLKAGLYDEFFGDFKNVFVPFMDPKVYKRSILENSSFIVSSANPNPANHGRGFVARLSGGAAEFIDIWIIMMTGKKLFSIGSDGKLYFQLKPVLPAWLFDKKGELSFKLLGSIDVTYLNPKGENTFNRGVVPTSYKLIFDDREEVVIRGGVVTEPYAKFIRERQVKKIIVTLA